MRFKDYVITIMLAVGTMFLVFSLIRYPQIAFDSALRGLKIWWDIVFPALLPFMVISEIMMGFGVVHFMSVLLEPLMRPLFNVPGAGGFVMAMGFASGYPVGPKLAARLREQKLVSRAEGERLVCFTSTSDPLFIFGAVAVGFFHNPELGISIAVANYAGAILLGLLLRFHDRKEKKTTYNLDKELPLILRALRSMHRARLQDNRPLGKLMGDAVLSSFQTLFVVGGFIIFFSVLMVFLTSGIFESLLTFPLTIFLNMMHIPNDMAHSLIIGFFEVTQSMKTISDLVAVIDLKIKIAIASGLIAWGGISVHAQVASIISSTDMRYKPYFVSKIVHSLFAGIITLFIWDPISQVTSSLHIADIPVFMAQIPHGSIAYTWDAFHYLGYFAISIVCLLAVLSFLYTVYKKTRKVVH